MVAVVAHADDGNLGTLDEADHLLCDAAGRSRTEIVCLFDYCLCRDGVDGTDLDSSAVLVARHAVHLVHDQDVFAAHGLRCAWRDAQQDKMLQPNVRLVSWGPLVDTSSTLCNSASGLWNHRKNLR